VTKVGPSRFAWIALAALASCASPPTGPHEGGGARPGVAYPFAPASMRIHPLTRLERGDGGRPLLVCHVEVKDAWGDTTKSIGALQVQLYRPGEGPDASLERQELRWDVDLSDLTLNARLYDPATRTYRLPLRDLPPWLTINERGGPAQRVRLRVVLTTTGADGAALTLAGDLVME